MKTEQAFAKVFQRRDNIVLISLTAIIIALVAVIIAVTSVHDGDVFTDGGKRVTRAEFFEKHGKRAARAFLERSHSNFKDPEMLNDYFLSDAFQKAKAVAAREREELSAEHFKQEPEFTSGNVLVRSRREAVVVFKGALRRPMHFAGQWMTNRLEFRLSLSMIVNPVLAEYDRPQAVVVDFAYEPL